MVGTSESGNPNPSPSTRFGGEKSNKPYYENPLANKPWSIRHAQKYFAALGVNIDDIVGKSEDEIIKILLPNPKKTTLAQIGAARQMLRFARENVDASGITDNIDGKLAQPTLNADITDIINRSDDQLNEIIEAFNNTRQNHTPDGSSSGDRASEEAGGEDSASAEA